MFHPAQVLHNLPQKWCKHQFKANSRYVSHSQRDTLTLLMGSSSNGWMMMMDDYGCQKQNGSKIVYVMVSPTPVKNKNKHAVPQLVNLFPKIFFNHHWMAAPQTFGNTNSKRFLRRDLCHSRCDSTQPWAAKVRRVRSSWSSELEPKNSWNKHKSTTQKTSNFMLNQRTSIEKTHTRNNNNNSNSTPRYIHNEFPHFGRNITLPYTKDVKQPTTRFVCRVDSRFVSDSFAKSKAVSFNWTLEEVTAWEEAPKKGQADHEGIAIFVQKWT